MEDAESPSGHRWRFGVHPAASGSVIRSITRVSLPVGDALRIEMAETPTAEPIHVQYHIATESGGWALWTSCTGEELATVDAALPELAIPGQSEAPA
jgi:hypothetical protein